MQCECNLHKLSGNTSGLAAVAEIGLKTCIQLVVRAVTGCGGHECLWYSLLIDLVSLKVFHASVKHFGPVSHFVRLSSKVLCDFQGQGLRGRDNCLQKIWKHLDLRSNRKLGDVGFL